MIESDTLRLSLPEGRRVGEPGHDRALNYISARMKEVGLEPFSGGDYALPYEAVVSAEGPRIRFTNLAGIIEGNHTGSLPVLIGAHYDSAIDAPSSDDNAVSVALILSMAKKLKRMDLGGSVVVVFFDAEEAPFFLTGAMGSTRFYRDHCAGTDFACALIIDMVGHDFQTGVRLVDAVVPALREMLFVLGAESHEMLPRVVERTSLKAEKLRVISTLNRYIGDRSDHHVFRTAGQPFLFFSKGWGVFSHTPLDTPAWINFERVEKTEKYLLNIVEEIDKVDMRSGRRMTDPLGVETRMMRRALGWPVWTLLHLLAFPGVLLRSRKDMDTLTGRLLRIAGWQVVT